MDLWIWSAQFMQGNTASLSNPSIFANYYPNILSP